MCCVQWVFTVRTVRIASFAMLEKLVLHRKKTKIGMTAVTVFSVQSVSTRWIPPKQFACCVQLVNTKVIPRRRHVWIVRAVVLIQRKGRAVLRVAHFVLLGSINPMKEPPSVFCVRVGKPMPTREGSQWLIVWIADRVRTPTIKRVWMCVWIVPLAVTAMLQDKECAALAQEGDGVRRWRWLRIAMRVKSFNTVPGEIRAWLDVLRSCVTSGRWLCWCCVGVVLVFCFHCSPLQHPLVLIFFSSVND